jgi:hypothetical protein
MPSSPLNPSAASFPASLAELQVRHLSLTSVAYLKAITTFLDQGGGSHGSHMVLHPEARDPRTGRPLRFKKESRRLRRSILQVRFEPTGPDLFRCCNVSPRRGRRKDVAFEIAWERFRNGRIFT